MSFDDKTTVRGHLSFVEQGKTITGVTSDQAGYIYILSHSTIFKCIFQSQLHLLQSLGNIQMSLNNAQIIVTNNHFYLSDPDTGRIYQCNQNKSAA